MGYGKPLRMKQEAIKTNLEEFKFVHIKKLVNEVAH